MQKLFLKERVVDYNSLLDMKEDMDGDIVNAKIVHETKKTKIPLPGHSQQKPFIKPSDYPDVCNQLLTLINKWDSSKLSDDYIVWKFNYLIYNKGDYYKRHKDIAPVNNIAQSTYSTSTLIAKSTDLIGGDLILFDNKNTSLINTDLQVGETVFFDSTTPHKVDPVIKGTREVIISWIYKKSDLEKYNYRAGWEYVY